MPASPIEPRMTSQFLAYDENYKDGVALSTGWVAGAEGGAKSIVTSQLAGDGTVRVWSTGSRSTGSRACTWKVRTTTRRTSSTPRSLRSHRSPGQPRARPLRRPAPSTEPTSSWRERPRRPGGPQVHPRAPGAGRDDVGAEADRHPAEDADGPDTARRPLGQVPEHLGHEVEDHDPEQRHDADDDGDAPPVRLWLRTPPAAAAASSSAADSRRTASSRSS